MSTTTTTIIASANGITNERERSVNFFDRGSSIPMVANTMSYISSKYSYVKGVNGKVEAFLSGVERSFKRITTTAYNFSKKIVPYEYFDKLASASLDKIEAAFLLVKNTGKKIPDSIKALNTSYTEKISSLTKTTLKKVENMIDYAFPAKENESTKTEEKGVLERGICIISQIRIWVLTAAKRVAHLKGETVTDLKLLSIKDMVNIAEHWLSNSYKRLQIKPTEEGILMKALRLSTLLTIGTTLSAIVAVEATLPGVKELTRVTIIKSKAAVYATSKLSIHIRNEVYANAQRKVAMIVEISKKLQKDVLERLPFLMNSKQMAAGCLIHSEEVPIEQSDLERTSPREKVLEEEFKEVGTSSNENAEEMGSGESTDPRYYEVLPQNVVSNNHIGQEKVHEFCNSSTQDLEKTSDTFQTLDNSSTLNTLPPSSSDTSFSPCDALPISQGSSSSPSLESEDLAKSLSDQQKIIKPKTNALLDFFRR